MRPHLNMVLSTTYSHVFSKKRLRDMYYRLYNSSFDFARGNFTRIFRKNFWNFAFFREKPEFHRTPVLQLRKKPHTGVRREAGMRIFSESGEKIG